MAPTPTVEFRAISGTRPRSRSRDVLSRWIAFNIVGLGGIAVQLGVVALLVHVAGWPNLVATAIAVESAILHNFAWHQRWTWKHRPSRGRETIVRVARFHLLNGSISLAGNVGVTALATSLLHADVLLANAIAIVLCSLVNFVAGETMVFIGADHPKKRRHLDPRTVLTPLASVVLLSVVATPVLAGPSQPTVAAWRAYEGTVDRRYSQAVSATERGFFALDRDNLAPGWREAVLQGGQRMVKIDAAPVPDGKIHHWVGAIFVPNITIEALVERLEENAGRESESYQDVLASRLIDRRGDTLRVFMKLRRTNLITVTYNTEHTVEYRRVSAARASARSVATRIAELADVGTAQEREKNGADDNGFLWELNAYWRYEAAQGGVIVECESVSLSRAVPFVVRPVANPIVDRIARESLDRTLVSLRAALKTEPSSRKPLTSRQRP